MSSLLKANWDRQAGGQTGGQAQVSIGMHAHPKKSICKQRMHKLSQWLKVAYLFIICKGSLVDPGSELSG
jgi:hypothetical protein